MRGTPGDVLGKTNLFLYSGCPEGIYLLKVNNRDTRTRSEICSKLTIKNIFHTLF